MPDTDAIVNQLVQKFNRVRTSHEIHGDHAFAGAYSVEPEPGVELDAPCFVLHDLTLISQDLRGSQDRLFWRINLSVFVSTEVEQGQTLAHQYLDAILDVWYDDTTLGGRIQEARLQGEEPTVDILPWNRNEWLGLALYITYTTRDDRLIT